MEQNEDLIIESLLDIFGGNKYHAKSMEENGDIYYTPVEIPLTKELLKDHLDGKINLGSYQLLEKSDMIKWIA